jgi:hypothetical protein
MGSIVLVACLACTKYVFTWFKVRPAAPASVSSKVVASPVASSLASPPVPNTEAPKSAPILPAYSSAVAPVQLASSLPVPHVTGVVRSPDGDFILLSDNTTRKVKRHYKIGQPFKD